MDNDKLTISISIMDKKYRIACPQDKQDSLQQAANYLDKTMRAIREDGKIIGGDRIAMMAALNIAYDYLECDNKHKNLVNDISQQRKKIEYLTLQLEDSLEKSL